MCLKPREAVAQDASTLELVCEVVDDLSAALVNARIYACDHPRVRASADAVARFLRELPGDATSQGLRLATTGELLLWGDEPLIGASMTASRLIQNLDTWRAGGLSIDPGATADELILFLREIATRPEHGADWCTLNTRLEAANVRSARLLAPFVEADDAGRDAAGRTSLTTPLRFYQSCMDLLQDVTVAVCHGGHVDFGPVQTHVEAVLHQLDTGGAALMNLARQDQYDAFTFGHSVRVGVLAMSFARSLTRDRDLLLRIGTAALLHDCGKALVPFEILHSRDPLDDDARREMAKHAEFGAEILVDHDDADPLSVAAAFGHHRSAGGGGYPATRHVAENLLVTEIVKICDVYEALTAARPYKRPMSPIRAYRVMIGMGAHLDRALLRRFIGVNGIYPVGQLLLLSSGEVARVVAQTDDPSSPRVAITTDAGGAPRHEPDQPVVDLREPHGDVLRVVLQPIDRAPAASAPV